MYGLELSQDYREAGILTKAFKRSIHKYTFDLREPRQMAQQSSIEWTDATWNPVRGCTKISPGCAHCYAERFAERFRGVPGHPYEYGFDIRLVPESLLAPLNWSRQRMVFVNSMSDLFHDEVPDRFIEAVAVVMAAAPWHIFQVLTKRSDRLKDLLRTRLKSFATLKHIWWGVSVENRRHGIPRVLDLQASRAAVKFLSIEPLLEDLGTISLKGIDWVIVGGESGPGSRPMLIDWVRSIRRQCSSRKVPFFFKQWGGSQKGRNGRLLDSSTYDELPALHWCAPPVASQRRAISERTRASISDVLEVAAT